MSEKDSNVSVNFVADFDGDIDQLTNNIDIPNELPLLPLRNMVI